MKSLAVVAFAGIALIVALACGSTPASPGSEETPGPASEQPTGAEPDGPDMVEEPAPIDDVTVSATSDSPPEYVVHIKSGLPNGCHRFKGHEVSREGDTVKITVTNLKPADGLVACTMIYGTVETTIELGSDFDPGQSYKIDVNGAVSDLKAPASSQTVIEEAPIESVQIAVSQGQPAKNEMVIVLGLPDSCHEFVGYELDGEDDTFRIVVRNSRLTGPDVACAEIYRTVETRIDLGEDVEVCKAYTVVAGDEEYLVQAIAPNVRCKAPEVGADTVPVPPALAPIEDVSIRTTRSIPAQYTLVIRSQDKVRRGVPHRYSVDLTSGSAATDDETATRATRSSSTFSVTNRSDKDQNGALTGSSACSVRLRSTRAWAAGPTVAVVGRRFQRSRLSRSSEERCKGGMGRPMAMVTSMSVSWRVHPSKYFCNEFITQDTSSHRRREHSHDPVHTGAVHSRDSVPLAE